MSEAEFEEDTYGKVYRLNSDDNAEHHPAGTVCYPFLDRDYGTARFDSKKRGVPYVSMTLKQDGSGPFFTVPKSCLVEVRSGDEVESGGAAE